MLCHVNVKNTLQSAWVGSISSMATALGELERLRQVAIFRKLSLSACGADFHVVDRGTLTVIGQAFNLDSVAGPKR